MLSSRFRHPRASHWLTTSLFVPARQGSHVNMRLTELRALPQPHEQYPHGLTSLSSSCTMAQTIERLGHVQFVEYQHSQFVQPQSVRYQLDDKDRRWCAFSLCAVLSQLQCSSPRIRAADTIRHRAVSDHQ